MAALARAARGANAVVVPLVRRWPAVLGRRLAVVAYTGRRSGRSVRLVTAYRRTAGTVAVTVAMAEHKTWWRNFTGAGGPVEIELQGQTYAGTATARRDAGGAVVVEIALEAPGRAGQPPAPA
jgi:hypothetical protein